MRTRKPAMGPLKGPRGRWRQRRRLYVTLGVPLVLLGTLYVADLFFTSGKVPRGITAAGVPLGGLTPGAAEQRLRDVVGPRADRPVPVTLGTEQAEVDPRAIDLTLLTRPTVDQAGGQPLNPVTRFMSIFVTSPISVVSSVDEEALTAALEELGTRVASDPVDGSIEFIDGEPVASDPQPGRRLDVTAAAEAFQRDWAAGGTVDLPTVETPPGTTTDDVDAALREIANPAVSGPVTVVGDGGTRAVISADVIATALTFRVSDGQLTPEIDRNPIIDELRPQLAESETERRDADIDFTVTPPVKTREQAGRRVDYDTTLADLPSVLTNTEDRQITADYVAEEPTFTFDDINELGPVEVIGEFRTTGFATDSGKNIRRAAEQIDGAVVGPGETFSLNDATNPRDAASGYVEAGTIQNGRPSRGIGGGVSQLATTLFNAGYFAGMEDVEHHEHSYYISRYPAGREATVFGDVLDVKFRNDGPTSVQIQTAWTSESLTVRIVGIKRYEVSSSQSSRSRPTSPQTVRIPAGEACSPGSGGPGFTITDTRTLREIATGRTRTESHTVVYDPIPRVVCGG